MSKLIRRHAGLFQLVFVIGAVGIAVTLSSTMKPERSSYPSAPPAQDLAVSVVSPVETSFRSEVSLNGIVEARTVTDIVPEVSGRVVDVSSAFRTGGTVARGDLLFAIDPADYKLAVERTLAEIEAARSELALLEAEAAAEKQVWATQFPDRDIPDLRARVPQIAAAKARIRSAEAARRSAELALDRTVVRAPFDARVLDTRLDVGQVVGTITAVGSVFAVDSLEIVVPVSADELRRIGDIDGRKAWVQSEVGMGRLEGSIVRMAAALDERTRLATLFVAAEDSSRLMAGEFVTISIDGQETPRALEVPTDSLTSRDRLWVVENGRLAPRTVDVLGIEGQSTIVAAFDSADGIVTMPPPASRAGLPVSANMATNLASTSGGSSASSK